MNGAGRLAVRLIYNEKRKTNLVNFDEMIRWDPVSRMFDLTISTRAKMGCRLEMRKEMALDVLALFLCELIKNEPVNIGKREISMRLP